MDSLMNASYEVDVINVGELPAKDTLITHNTPRHPIRALPTRSFTPYPP